MASCPRCGNRELRRSHRRGPVDHVLALVKLRPFRCEFCEIRFHAYQSSPAPRRTPLHESAGK